MRVVFLQYYESSFEDGRWQKDLAIANWENWHCGSWHWPNFQVVNFLHFRKDSSSQVWLTELHVNRFCPTVFRICVQSTGSPSGTGRAKAHTAEEAVHWLRLNVPDFVEPDQSPAKSPHLNMFDYCVWSLLLYRVQLQRSKMHSIEGLKTILTDVWNDIRYQWIPQGVQYGDGQIDKTNVLVLKEDTEHFWLDITKNWLFLPLYFVLLIIKCA